MRQFISRLQTIHSVVVNNSLYRQVYYSLSIATILLLLVSCQSAPISSENVSMGNSEASGQKKPLKDVKVTLSWLFQGVNAPLAIAIDKGYFAQEGLNISFERGYGSADTIGKIAAGQYDIGFGDLYSMIEFNEKNPEQKLIAVGININKAPFSIISLKKNGIDSPNQLAGKKLGAPVGDAARRLWPIFAKQIGLKPNSVTWTTIEPRLTETFLLQGRVDAISSFAYSSLPSLAKGGADPKNLNIFYYSDNGLNFYGNAVIAKASFVKENPKTVRAFIKALIRGTQETLRNPDAGVEAVMKLSNQPLDEEMERFRLKILLDNLMVNEEVKKNGLFTVENRRLQESIRQAVEGFELTKSPEINEVFDSKFLPAREERLPPSTK